MAPSREMANGVGPPGGFWSAVRDVVRCNRKDGKRWQCAREVLPGQKYCERHIGRGRNRPKRSAEDYSETSEVPTTPSLGAISSVTMAGAAEGVISMATYSDLQPSPVPNERSAHIMPESGSAAVQCGGFEKIARVKTLYNRVRSNFPYFEKNRLAFMENAGGSQCPGVVIDAISDYMRTSYAQLGAGHEISDRADETVNAAHEYMRTFTNARGFGEVVFGPSTSQLVTNLSICYSSVLREGDEVIIHEANHEANLAPWLRMAASGGIAVKWWRINYDTFESDLANLAHLLSPRTRIVAVPHVSNILGQILDLEGVVKMVKSRIYERPIRVIADGVAYAPHRAVDVAKWGVDWYVFSSYKVYGPHMAVLFGTHNAFMDVKNASPNWDFLPADEVSKKFELGGVCHEACAGLVALSQYFRVLAKIGESFSFSSDGSEPGLQPAIGGHMENIGIGKAEIRAKVEYSNALLTLPEDRLKGQRVTGPLHRVPDTSTESLTSSSLRDWEFALQGTSFGHESVGFGATMASRLDRVVLETAYNTVVLLEKPLQEKLLAFLRSRADIVILGPQSSAAELRVPTVSFIHVAKNSAEISRALQSAGFAVRHGHMYSFRLMSGLAALDKLSVNSVDDGAVRISLVHYNTPVEVARLIACLQSIL